MQSNDPAQILSQEQIADAINRAKVGSQRQKNEMMRLGTSDPTSFQMNFNKQLQDQAAPQEFWGAGRKLASNQNPDQETVDYTGAALPSLGGQRYYYGDTDFSIPENIQKSILGAGYKTTGGQVDKDLSGLFGDVPLTQYHGQSYYKGGLDPSDSNALITRAGWKQGGADFDPTIANILGSKTANYKGQSYYQGDYDPSKAQWGTQGYNQQDIGGGRYNILDPSGNNLGIGYKSLDDTIRELTSKYNTEHPLQQDFTMDPTPSNIQQQSSYDPNFISGGDLEKWEMLGQLLNDKPLPTQFYGGPGLVGNNQEESIKGLNTLFGSTPLIANGKVAGYKFDPTPAESNLFGYQNPNLISRIDNKGSTRYNQSLSRDYNDLNSWSNLVKGIDENSMYVPSENAEQLPGWVNKDTSQYQHTGSGIGNKIASAVGTALQFTPLAPLGMALSTLSSLQSGNHLGALANVLGNTGSFNEAGKALGDTLGLGADAGKYFVKGGLGALSSLGKGGSGALLSGLGAGIGGATGDLISSNLGDTLGQTGSNILGGGVSGSLQSLFNKSNPLQGAMSGGLSSGLGSFLSSMTDSGGNMDNKRREVYNKAGKTLIDLIKPIQRKIK